MKIAVIGSTGFVGASITKELANRNYEVLAISRSFAGAEVKGVTHLNVDVTDSNKLDEAIRGYDVVISAYNAGWQNPNIYNDFMDGAKAIQAAVTKANVKRFIVIGGAGSLYIADGVQLIDTPNFPKEIYAGANAARNYYDILKTEENLDWILFSTAPEMHQGITTGRTGKYRLGKDEPVFNDDNRSILSVEDLAVVIADEVDNQQHSKERFTAAY